MLKFINSLATIEVNKEIPAIQVTFMGTGTAQQYAETFRMAGSFARLHNISSFLLVKNTFEDLSSRRFCSLLEDWLQLMSHSFNRKQLYKSKIALLVDAEVVGGMHSSLHAVQQHHGNNSSMLLDLFCNWQQAASYLQSKTVETIYLSTQ